MASLPYPRSHKTIFPTEFTEHTETTGGEEKSVNSVKSVGGSSPPEASVYSVKSVGEYPPPEISVNSVNSVGGLTQTNLEWVLWKEFGGQRGYGIPAIPTLPQNYLPTEFTEHTETTGGEEKICVHLCNLWEVFLRQKLLCIL